MMVEIATGAWINIENALELRLFQPAITDEQMMAVVRVLGAIAALDDGPSIVVDEPHQHCGYYRDPVVRVLSECASGEMECLISPDGLVSVHTHANGARFDLLRAWAEAGVNAANAQPE